MGKQILAPVEGTEGENFMFKRAYFVSIFDTNNMKS